MSINILTRSILSVSRLPRNKSSKMSIVEIPKIIIPQHTVYMPKDQLKIDSLEVQYTEAKNRYNYVRFQYQNSRDVVEKGIFEIAHMTSLLTKLKRDHKYHKHVSNYYRRQELKQNRIMQKLSDRIKKQSEKARDNYLKAQEKLDWNVSNKVEKKKEKKIQSEEDDNNNKMKLLKSLVEKNGYNWSSDYFVMYKEWDEKNQFNYNRYKKMCVFIDENKNNF
jgi:hypothetical protein